MDHQGQQAGWLPADAAMSSDRERAIFWRNRLLILFDLLPLPAAFCEADGTIRVVNSAMALEWGVLPGHLSGHNALALFRLTAGARLHPVNEAVRLRRRSRYPVEVSWSSGSGTERHGELNIDVVTDQPDAPPNLLLLLRVVDRPAAPAPAPGPEEHTQVSAVEARILALAAGGSTTTQIAAAVGLTADGVNYHFRHLSQRWGTTSRTALVARAYATGVLAPGTWPPAPAHRRPR
ncbi:DNA-binding CsgD family transcriptional regulator [Kitasatospora sp. GAS204A]|uniref:helix-turn-helix transcriptional regulator n=1 Tax=unclassified Kitasatospora TaxID=2633591 RepID=UPI002476AFF1|nr:LuxR C-terminal-related transcriptional regulator [Kitasatospora sp. GAS204B]MDH6120845.1 DNA-binding CsgD family transcriptional regulator [Kitasatospora sp. GAS204B]